MTLRLPHLEPTDDERANFKLFSDLFDLGYPLSECTRIARVQFEDRHRVTPEDIRRWLDLFGELPE